MSRNYTFTPLIILFLRCKAVVFAVVCFVLFNFSSSGIAKDAGGQLEEIGDQVTSFVGLDDQHLDSTFSFVQNRVSKFRKRYKHVNDYSLELQLFGKRISQKYAVPYSIIGYTQPQFACAQYGFLYRLTYF